MLLAPGKIFPNVISVWQRSFEGRFSAWSGRSFLLPTRNKVGESCVPRLIRLNDVTGVQT
jgi:hypothetical protein